MTPPPPLSLSDILADRIESRTFRRVSRLRVRLVGGTVTVRGACGSFHAKQLATQAVRELLPHAEIRNALRVTLPGLAPARPRHRASRLGSAA